MSKPLISALNQDDPLMEEIVEALYDVRHPFEIALLGSDNYFNLGAIVRTSHAFLVKKLYAVGIDGGCYKKASMGALKYERYSMVQCEEENFRNYLIEENRNVVVFEKRPGLATEDIRPFEYPDNPVFVFGSEKNGIPDYYMENYPVVSIPMFGITNDLNVALAVGIVCYDFVRKFYSAEHHLKSPYAE